MCDKFYFNETSLVVKEAIKDGTISISTANEIAKCSDEVKDTESEKVDTNINIDINKLFSEEISKLIDEQSDAQKKVLMTKIEEAVINTFGRDFFNTFLKKCCKDCYYFDEEIKLWF